MISVTNQLNSLWVLPAFGLSPRVRGNPSRPNMETAPARSIPACAGEPPLSRSVFAPRKVYPRVCGGTTAGLSGSHTGDALSPRVRGNHTTIRSSENDTGSIPACAGEPGTASLPREKTRVYPRVCGGTRQCLPISRLVTGLSPRVRGNPRCRSWLGRRPRSIPACAGEPNRRGGLFSPIKVYPRVCGGTSRPSSSVGSKPGLSPRVRGNHAHAQVNGEALGSIPACAGEPFTRGRPKVIREVYPRVCGGTGWAFPPTWPEDGLSPRVRGNPASGASQASQVGSIPACAGEPFSSAIGIGRLWVYPRVCGGTIREGEKALVDSGLSPRVRGNRSSTFGIAASQGSIPACAGEPK